MNTQKGKASLSRTRENLLDRLNRGYEMELLGMRETDISRALGYAGHSGWQNLKKAHKAKQQKSFETQMQAAGNLPTRLPHEENALVEKICVAFGIGRADLETLIDLYLSVKTGV